MAKTYTITMDGMNFTAPTQAEAVAMAKEFVKSFTPTTAGTSEKGKGKKDKKLVNFTKADGTTVQCTEAQAKVWEAYRNRGHKSVEELKALKPQISAKGKAFVKANPSCTRKEAAANGCKNITKEGLKALKRELGVR